MPQLWQLPLRRLLPLSDEGVVPASYVEQPTGAGRWPTRAKEPEEEDGVAERESEERAAAEQSRT